MGDILKGQPPQQNITLPPPLRPPMYGAANFIGNQLPSLWGAPLPSYPGQLDRGLSPTQSMATRFMQNRAQQPGPQVLGQAQGTLGALMNPGQSGLRNPYSMSSNAMGGGSVMTPEGLASSRQALLRYQNPTMAIQRPGMTAPNFFPPMSAGPPGGGGGGGGARPVPPAGGGMVPRPSGFLQPTLGQPPSGNPGQSLFGRSTQGPGQGGMPARQRLVGLPERFAVSHQGPPAGSAGYNGPSTRMGFAPGSYQDQAQRYGFAGGNAPPGWQPPGGGMPSMNGGGLQSGVPPQLQQIMSILKLFSGGGGGGVMGLGGAGGMPISRPAPRDDSWAYQQR